MIRKKIKNGIPAGSKGVYEIPYILQYFSVQSQGLFLRNKRNMPRKKIATYDFSVFCLELFKKHFLSYPKNV